jgi:hypothetical protein
MTVEAIVKYFEVNDIAVILYATVRPIENINVFLSTHSSVTA